MKPIDQTIFGEKTGNCFQACLASMLEISLGAVTIDTQGIDWLDQTQKFLYSRNLVFVQVRLDVCNQYPFYPLQNVPVIFMGRSPRGKYYHQVVGVIKHNVTNNQRVFEILHDPHPDRKGLVGDVIGVGLLVKLNTAKQ